MWVAHILFVWSNEIYLLELSKSNIFLGPNTITQLPSCCTRVLYVWARFIVVISPLASLERLTPWKTLTQDVLNFKPHNVCLKIISVTWSLFLDDSQWKSPPENQDSDVPYLSIIILYFMKINMLGQIPLWYNCMDFSNVRPRKNIGHYFALTGTRC